MNNQNIFSHQGYLGTCETSVEDGCLHGRLLHIRDVITYEADTVPELKAAFEEAVNDYLEHCAEVGKSPDKVYSGTFNVRVGSERHKKLAERAATQAASINEVLNEFIDLGLQRPPAPEITIHLVESASTTSRVAAISSSALTVIHRTTTTGHSHERATATKH